MRLSFSLFFVLFLCNSNEVLCHHIAENKNIDLSLETEWVWINSEYFNCIKADLPCNYGGSEFLLAYFNGNDSTEFMVEVNNRDNLLFDNLVRVENGIFKRMNDASFIIEVSADTLFSTAFSKKVKFGKYPKIKAFEYNNYLGKINLSALNEILSKSGFDLMNTLNLSEKYSLYCSNELNSINLINRYGTAKNWIVEKEDSHIHNKYLNPEEIKSCYQEEACVLC